LEEDTEGLNYKNDRLNSNLQRQIKIMATNAIDENKAVVLNDNPSCRYGRQYQRDYYHKNRERIVEEKRINNQQPGFKQDNPEY